MKCSDRLAGRGCLNLALLLSLGLSSFAAVIPPARTMTWQGHVGIPGGIPSVTTVFTNLSPSGGDDTAMIQAAINRCPSNRVVKLGAGNFNITGLDFQGAGDGVVLRGSGPTNTRLTITGNATGGRIHIRRIVDGTYRTASVNLAADSVVGNNTVTLASMPTWIVVGGLYWIDELNESVVCNNIGQEGAPDPNSRGLRQMVKVTGISGNTITTEEPVNFAFKVSQTAQLTKCGYSPEVHPAPKMDALEDFTVTSTWSANDIMADMMRIEGGERCWVKNVVSTNCPGGDHIRFFFSYKCEVRHCYFGYSFYYGAGRGYGVAFYGGDANCLVVDNIFEHLHCPMETNEGSMGNVLAYNYEKSGTADSGQFPAIVPHACVSWLNLFEGNWCEDKIDTDYVHGSGGYMNTYYRNRIIGTSSDPVPVVVEQWSRRNNFAGNVLGQSGFHNMYQAIPVVGGIAEYTAAQCIWRLGYWGSWGWHDLNGSSPTYGLVSYDALPVLDVLRVLNWDAANNGIADAGTNQMSDLVPSYFMGAKPAWFGDRPWPSIDPGNPQSAVVTNLPAGYRYIFGTDPPTAGGANQPPVPVAGANPSSGMVPLGVAFSSAGSYDPEGAPLTYNWVFGDGASSTAANPSHTYSVVGTYTAQLTVSDGTNNASAPVTITVTNTAPIVALTAPVDGATFNTPTNINLSATVNPNGHSVTKIQFYNGGTLLGERTTAPYTVLWTNVIAGTYSLTAQAVYDAGSTVSSAPAAVTVYGLVAAYGFEEGNGSIVSDASGHGNTGTLNGATWASGRFGSGLSFNGTSAMVTINDSASLHFTGGMTLEAWVNPAALGATWSDIIFKAPDVFFLMGTTPQGQLPDMGGTFASGNVYGTAVLPLNTWTHLAGTYDGTTMTFYVNGVQVASRPQTGPIATSNGALSIGGDSTSGQFWTGLIDEVRIYNRALAANEVVADMGGAIRRPPPPSGLRVVGP
jgi:PKD repeat protein